MDASFLDLVLWGLVPLTVAFTLWALVDCLRRPISGRARLGYGLLILLLPFWGALLWLRSPVARRAAESPLLNRVRQRRNHPPAGPARSKAGHDPGQADR